jgi:AcrR family transcriptional regulator
LNAAHDDRRVRRTRRLLREALLALILEQGYDQVTVQDILDRADIGRATFYAHFQDKDALLVSGFEELRDSLRQQLAALVRGRGDAEREQSELVHILFEHAASHAGLYRALVGKRGGGIVLKRAHEELAALLREHFEDAFAQHQLQPVVPSEVMIQFLVSALLGLLTWWLDKQMPYPPDEMSRAFWHLTHSGVSGVLDTSSTTPPAASFHKPQEGGEMNQHPHH